jgi:hypothetical protein
MISILSYQGRSDYRRQYSDSLQAGRSSVGRDFPDRSRPCPRPTQPPVQWVPISFPGVKLTTHPLLPPFLWVKGKGKGRCCGAHSALPALKADCTLAHEVVPSVISRGAPHQAAREASISEGRKQNSRILPTTRNFTAVVGVFDMPQSWDMGQII